MKFVEAHYPLYETRATRTIGMAIAVPLLVMTLAQLFSFDDFYMILADFWNLSSTSGAALASVIVAMEVFALPFLLGMKLSTGMRLLCAFLLLLVTAYWGVTALAAAFVYTGIDTGLFGGVAVAMGGIGLLVYATLLLGSVTVYFAQVYLDSHQLHRHLRKNLK